jgi:hypothetical protein
VEIRRGVSRHTLDAGAKWKSQMEILEKLKDLLLQATSEHSHNYVAATVTAAIAEIEQLRHERDVAVARLRAAAARRQRSH